MKIISEQNKKRSATCDLFEIFCYFRSFTIFIHLFFEIYIWSNVQMDE